MKCEGGNMSIDQITGKAICGVLLTLLTSSAFAQAVPGGAAAKVAMPKVAVPNVGSVKVPTTNLNGAKVVTTKVPTMKANSIIPGTPNTGRMVVGASQPGLANNSLQQINANNSLPQTNLLTGQLNGSSPLLGAQSARLNQLNIAAGNPASLSPLQQQLSLTSPQLSQINQFQTAYNQQITELNNRALSDPQGTSGLYAQARQQLQQQVGSVLTPQQRLTLSQATGVPDSFSGDNAFQNFSNRTGGASSLNPNGTFNNVGGTTLNNMAGTQLRTLNNSNLNNLSPGIGSSAAASGMRSNALNSMNSGFMNISNPAVQQQLGLSTSQLSQLQTGQLNYIQQLGDLSSRFRTDPQGTLSLYNNAMQQSQQQINAILTPQQRQILTNLTGITTPVSGSTSQ